MKIEDLILDPERAIYVEKEKTLVISDLHIGIEEGSLIGIRIQGKDIMNRIMKLKKKYRFETIILNGDLKHSFNKESIQERDELQIILDELIKEGIHIIGIKGNHDYYLQNIFGKRGEVKEYIIIGEYMITHGHRVYKVEEEIKKTIIGDEHPSITLRDEIGVRAKIPVFLVFEDLIVEPAFNKLSKGTDLLTSKDFVSEYLKNRNVDEGEIYGINEDELLRFGKLKELKKILKN